MSQAAGTVPPPLPPTEPTRSLFLDRTLVRGLAWTAVVKWGSQIVAWVATLVVARILVPADYGLLAMATVFVGLIALVSDFGLGLAIVMLRDLLDEHVAQINTLSLLLGTAAVAASCIAAVPLGRFFATPALPLVVVSLSIGCIVLAFRTVPYALLQKEMRFKLLALIDGAQTLVTSLSMMMLALLGLGYWTLVLGGLFGWTVSSALAVAARRYRFARPRLHSLRRAITFSGHITATRLAFYLYSSVDLFVAGKTLPRTAVGGYSLASTLAVMAPEKLMALLGSVAPSIFSSVQSESVRLRRYLLLLTEGAALVTFPITLGLAAVASEFVLVVLGDKWLTMVAPLQIMAAYASFRALVALPGNVLNVIGETRFAMWIQVVAVATFPFAFFYASRWGAVGIASAWVVVHPLVSAPLFWRVFRRIDVSVRQYLDALSPALTGSAVMLLAIAILKRMMPSTWSPLLVLCVQVVTGAVAYVAPLLILRRDRLQTITKAWKLLRS
jgi:O-antigen/teichoic acid export membrane protein